MAIKISTWAATALVLAILLQGCCATGSGTARFYVLTPAASPAETTGGETGTGDISISIAPVTVPRYLKKPQIVTRTGSNELLLSEFDRWAGRLEEDIGRVIAENLALILSSDRVLSYPSASAGSSDYTVHIDVLRFDGRLGGDLELDLRWTVLDSGGNSLYRLSITRITEPADNGGYAGMVEAQSRALASFSHELAAVIKKLAAE